MMDKKLLGDCISYLFIFAISSGIAIFFFHKIRMKKVLGSIISAVESLILINVNFHLIHKLGSTLGLYLSEFLEIFWFVPPAG